MLLSKRIYGLRMILRINTDYFPQHDAFLT
jgi:hypothetical protein